MSLFPCQHGKLAYQTCIPCRAKRERPIREDERRKTVEAIVNRLQTMCTGSAYNAIVVGAADVIAREFLPRKVKS